MAKPLSRELQQKWPNHQSSPPTVRSRTTDWTTLNLLPVLQDENSWLSINDTYSSNTNELNGNSEIENNDILRIRLLNEIKCFDIPRLSCFQFYNEGKSLIVALENGELQLFDIEIDQNELNQDDNNAGDAHRNIQLILKKRINLNMASVKNITRIEILSDLDFLIIENSSSYSSNLLGNKTLFLFKFSNFKYVELLKQSKDFHKFEIYDFQYELNLNVKYNNIIIEDTERVGNYRFTKIPRFSYVAILKNKELTIFQFPSNGTLSSNGKIYFTKSIKFNSKIKNFQFISNKKKRKRKVFSVNESIKDTNNVSMLVVLNDLKIYLLKNLININEDDQQILMNHANHFQVILLDINLFSKNYFYSFNFKMLDIYNFENLTMLIKDNSSLLLSNNIQDDKMNNNSIVNNYDGKKTKKKLEAESEELKILNFVKNWKYPIYDIIYLYPYIFIIWLDLKTISTHTLNGQFLQSTELPFSIHSCFVDKFNNILYIIEKIPEDSRGKLITKVHRLELISMIQQLTFLEKFVNLKFSISLANQFLQNFPKDLKIYRFLQDLQIKINMGSLIKSIDTYYNFNSHHQKNESIHNFKKQMNLAIDTLSKFNTDPKLLLSLFPNFIHPILQNDMFESTDTSNISKSKISDLPVSYFLQHENSTHILLICLNSLIPYLTDTRRRLIIQNDKRQGVSMIDSMSKTSQIVSEASINSDLLRYEQDQLRLIDNTLFLCYLIVSPLLIAPLFRIKNYCDLDIVESKILNSRFKSMFVSDLLDFYYDLNLHDRSIELLINVITDIEGQNDNMQAIAGFNKRTEIDDPNIQKITLTNGNNNESEAVSQIEGRICEDRKADTSSINFDEFLSIAKSSIYNLESVKHFNRKYVNQYDYLIDYLCRINDIDLIFEGVQFMIKQNKTFGQEQAENFKECSFLKIFCCNSVCNKNFDRIKVFDFIVETYSIEFGIKYLEHIFNAYNDTTSSLHTKYIELLITVKDFSKFESYLSNNNTQEDKYYFEPRLSLKLIEDNLTDENYKELKYLQSLIYFKVNDFKKSIDILNDDLHDFTKCVLFCEKIRIKCRKDEDRLDIYQYLFDNLKSEDLKLKFFDNVKPDKFDPLKILSSDNFPTDASIESIKNSLLVDSINSIESLRNYNDLKAQLLKLKLLKLQQNLIKIKSEVIIIENSKCKYCGKSLIGMMLSCFKNGDVVHYGCVQDYIKSRKHTRYFLESKELD